MNLSHKTCLVQLTFLCTFLHSVCDFLSLKTNKGRVGGDEDNSLLKLLILIHSHFNHTLQKLHNEIKNSIHPIKF